MAELVGSLTAVLLADTKDFSAKMAEAKGEIAHAAACIEWFAEEAKRV